MGSDAKTVIKNRETSYVHAPDALSLIGFRDMFRISLTIWKAAI